MADMTSRLGMAKSLIGLTDTSEDKLILTYLTLAGYKLLERAYPFGTTLTDVPDRYLTKQVEIAVYLYNKRGAEGQTGHSESGINRQYENGDIPESLLYGVTPMVGIPE